MSDTTETSAADSGRRRPRFGLRPGPGRLGPIAPFEWLLALRYLGAKRKESFVSIISILSFIGIMLGVAVLIIVMAVMNGFRTELLSRILGLNGHVQVQAAMGPLTDFDAIAARVRTVPGVTRAVPIVNGQVLATANGVTGGAVVRGMRPEDLKQLPTVAANVDPAKGRGSLDDFKGNHAVAVGSRLAFNYGLKLGDRITLIAPKGPATPFGTVPQRKAYRVAAIFEVGMYEYDASYIFMPLDQARLFFDTGEGVSAIEVMVRDPDNVDAYRDPITRAIGRLTSVTTWKQSNKPFFDALQVERNVMFLILMMIILVAALNIISGMVMMVKDKGRDIAVLRTMGATRGSVMRVFLLAGAAVGVVGTLAGFLLGIAFAANIDAINKAMSKLVGVELFNPVIYFLSKLPAEVNNGEVAAVVVCALIISFLAPVYPAWRAARIDPVEALRYE